MKRWAPILMLLLICGCVEEGGRLIKMFNERVSELSREISEINRSLETGNASAIQLAPIMLRNLENLSMDLGEFVGSTKNPGRYALIIADEALIGGSVGMLANLAKMVREKELNEIPTVQEIEKIRTLKSRLRQSLVGGGWEDILEISTELANESLKSAINYGDASYAYLYGASVKHMLASKIAISGDPQTASKLVGYPVPFSDTMIMRVGKSEHIEEYEIQLFPSVIHGEGREGNLVYLTNITMMARRGDIAWVNSTPWESVISYPTVSRTLQRTKGGTLSFDGGRLNIEIAEIEPEDGRVKSVLCKIRIRDLLELELLKGPA